MPHRTQLSRRARNWLEDQSEYLLRRSPIAARRLETRISDALRQLSEFPRSGPQGQTRGTRRLITGPYILTYREAGPERVIVIDIRHGRQRETPLPEDLP
jgi:plasmid stabilization system protein ParE